jgi:hypothetical protein
MPGERWHAHTPYNHYALLAEAWLDGRLDLGGPPPAYTGNNDFAVHGDKHYVSFPPLPAVLILPVVAAAGGAENVPDGLFFVLLAPLGPVLFFLALERLQGRTGRSEQERVALAGLLGLGTVYWFSAVQGTVWFAAHVVALAIACGFVLCAVDARHPLLAGLLLGLGFATRPPLALALPFFVCEAWRGGGRARKLVLFAAPVACVVLVLAWHNAARFGDPTEFGHRLLAVRWRERIDEWGLFSYHYLGRNLGVVLAGLPFWSREHGLQVNAHGLALWLTTPIYVWALWPRRTSALYWAAAATAAAVALPSLLYQNTGWIQFGYRFSNDFAPFLFLMIAAGHRRLGRAFWGVAAIAVAVNSFGAATFGKPEHARYYFVDPTQRILFQPD